MQDIRKIKFDMHTPCLELEDFIQSIWFAENEENETALEYKIFSDGASGIIYTFGDTIKYQYSNGDIVSEKETITLGPSTKLLRMIFTGKVKTIGIRFFPFTAHHFF